MAFASVGEVCAQVRYGVACDHAIECVPPSTPPSRSLVSTWVIAIGVGVGVGEPPASDTCAAVTERYFAPTPATWTFLPTATDPLKVVVEFKMTGKFGCVESSAIVKP